MKPPARITTQQPISKTACVITAGLLLGGLIAGAVERPYPRFASWTAPRQIDSYLHTHPVRLLQIGAGESDLPGWLNTDIEPRTGQIYLDATRRFPMPDGSLNYIFAEHLIEHLSYDQGLAMLRECRRVLASGGKIRLSTPDLTKFFRLFQNPQSNEVQSYIAAKLKFHGWSRTSHPASLILNLEMSSFGHQFLYDPATLSDSLAQAGFQDIRQFAPGESDDAALRGVEMRHRRASWREMNDEESMVFQAVRP